jgi:hypothetical protein
MVEPMQRLLSRAALAVLLTGSTVTPPADAAFLTGNELFATCLQQPPNYLEMGACIGFVGAIGDAMAEAQISGATVMGLRACVPPGVTPWQARDVAVRFLTNHPEARRHAAAPSVVRSLAAAFPCPTRY